MYMDEFGTNSRIGTALPLTRGYLFGVAQTFLSAVSPTFLSAGLAQIQLCQERHSDAGWKALRYGRQEWLRYAIGATPEATPFHA
jgi:hypothetical protein